MRIEEEIKQKKFDNELVKATINILFTSSYVSMVQSQVLSPFDISWQQFNILRILRGRKGKPASLKTISERMIDRSSNTSRLVEKLRSKKLVERKINEEDRRKVDIFITNEGMELIEKASDAMDTSMKEEMSHLTEEEAAKLNDLLDKFRG
jgi:DNA-binding MarR family transcriptional regulator